MEGLLVADCSQALALWPASIRQDATRVMYAESGGRTRATNHNSNGTMDRGCWQVNSIHAWRVGGQLDKLFDPATNAQTALAIYNERGWCAWSSARKLGLCKR